MKSPFLKVGDPKLTDISQRILESEISSTKIEDIISKMISIAYGEQKDNKKPVMVGLAAPQIGILKRIILVDVAANGKGKVGKIKVYINPEITQVSKKKEEWYEGCYSTGKICGIVSRPISIKIKGLVWTPRRCTYELKKYTGYTARIFQHEIDHLNGILFIHHIKNPDNLHIVEKEEFPLYRNKQAWRNWSKKYPLPLA